MDYPKPTHQIVKTDLLGEKILAVISNLWGQQDADLAWEYYQDAVNDGFDYQLIKL